MQYNLLVRHKVATLQWLVLTTKKIHARQQYVEIDHIVMKCWSAIQQDLWLVILGHPHLGFIAAVVVVLVGWRSSAHTGTRKNIHTKCLIPVC